MSTMTTAGPAGTLDGGAAAATLPSVSLPPVGSRRLRWRQTRAAFGLELRKLLTGGSGVALALFGGLPVALVACWVIVANVVISRQAAAGGGDFADLADATVVFATLYRSFALAMIAFFACMMVFLNLVRREMRDRSLHYFFLSPVRREVVVAGKFAAGVAATFLVLGLSVALSHLLMYVPFLRAARPEVERFFLSGPGFGHLAAYVGITLLATIGYGAVFLAISVHFKNPVLPALAVYGWEWLHFLLPPMLKKLAVIHYLAALVPVPVNDGPFALVGEQPPAWLALGGLLALAAVLLALTMRRVRTMEVLYGED
jgi:ABC-type transport system involved in cytochrome c biogenesis permease component